MDNKNDRLTKSLVYPLIEKYYSSGDLPSVFYKREGLSESRFYTRRQRYLRDHPSVAKQPDVVLKPTRMPSRSPRTQASSGESASPSNSGFVRVDTIKDSSLFAEAVADYGQIKVRWSDLSFSRIAIFVALMTFSTNWMSESTSGLKPGVKPY